MKNSIKFNTLANKSYYTHVEDILYSVCNKAEKRYKLYSCKAEMRVFNGIIVLVSYETPVAVYTSCDETLYDCLRVVYGYTATSAQHISRFKKWLAENNYPIQNAVRFIN